MEQGRQPRFRFGVLSIRSRILVSALATVGLIAVLDASTLRSVATVETVTQAVRADTRVAGTVQETTAAVEGLQKAILGYALFESEAALNQVGVAEAGLEAPLARLRTATEGTALGTAAGALLSGKDALAAGGRAVADGVGQRRAATGELNKALTELRTVHSALQGFLLRENLGDLLQIVVRLGDAQQTGSSAALRYVASRNPADSAAALAEVANARKLIAEALAAGQALPRVQRLGKAFGAALDAYEAALRGAVQATDAVDGALKRMNALSTGIDTAVTALSDEAARGLTASLDGMTESVAETRTTTLWVSGVAILFALGMAWLISRSIGGQITLISTVMDRLAANDLDTEVPMVGRRDAIGAMARAVEVFKRNALEMRRMAAREEEMTRQAAEERAAAMRRMADNFERQVGGVIGTVSAEAARVEEQARTMAQAAEQTDKLASTVAAATEQTSANVQTVASASEELSSSIDEISRQVGESSRVAADAVSLARRANDKVSGLAEAAQKIGAVVELINGIASQTNLLALNATIEAARAGEAGKGFAVVASEVKALASQTAKATEEIAAQVSGVQDATTEAVEEILGVAKVIEHVSEIATTIASAIEEQGAATKEIARGIQQAAAGTREVAATIAGVSHAADEGGAAAKDLLNRAHVLASQGEALNQEVSAFLGTVRSA
ncbi:methyl-accepting chemotaxis protein [Azospirillum sp.]|uniref:methyl-accepting chemotaxis protein n=1 Tax=Azospirillum sp. TaxID=34012 RepID=UPI003D747A94